MKLHVFFAQFRIFIVTILAGLAVCAMGALVVHYGLSAAAVQAENEELKGEIRDLVIRLAEVESVLLEVEAQRKTLDRMTLAAVHTVIGQTTINAENDGKLYLASLDHNGNFKARDESLVGPPVDLASMVSRMEQIKSDARALLKTISSTSKGVALRQEILNAMPSRPPAKGWLSSDYGVRQSPFHSGEKMHNGVDIAADVGTPVYATADGVVAFAGLNGSYGKYIRINHGFGIATRYAHNAELLVKKGQKVRRGDQIGVIGLSGRTTGPHVHYEILVKDKPVDPTNFFFEETLAKQPPALAQISFVKPMGGETEPAVQSIVDEFATNVEETEELTAGPSRFLSFSGETLFFAAALPKSMGSMKTTHVMLLTAMLFLLAVASSLVRIPETRRFARATIKTREPTFQNTFGIWAGGIADEDEDE
jgi:murein DD-endopeptidase MepM/ murein hydrolase activator NlpD